jgi:hypothetical protein
MSRLLRKKIPVVPKGSMDLSVVPPERRVDVRNKRCGYEDGRKAERNN